MEREVPLTILYEDTDLLVTVKAPGIPSQPDPTGDPDQLSAVSEYLQRTAPGSTAGLVHRLDRGTGGVMLFGKNPAATARLSTAVQDKDAIAKEYLALVAGVPGPVRGEMRDLLFTDRRAGKTFVVDRARNGAKEAALLYRTLSTADRGGATLSLVRVKLLTGRTHQIRAQFASRRMPLCGDGKYGSRIKGTLGLWAWRLTLSPAVLASLPHAKAGQNAPLILTAPPAGDPFDTEWLGAIDAAPWNDEITETQE